jgi:hypothetical protein
MGVVIKIVDTIKKDTTSETYPIASGNSLGYLWLVLFFSCFSWMTLAYIWSFLFKSEIIGFVVLALVLGVGAFLDMFWAFLALYISLDTASDNKAAITLLDIIRWLFMFLFPNVTIKKALFNLKIRENSFCIDSLNTLLKSKLLLISEIKSRE